jgi:hypothetical protein
MIVRARVQMRTRPAGALLAVEAEKPGPLTPAQAARARELAVALDRAARHGVLRPTCLVRSLALCRLLSAHGIHGARIHVGVRWNEGEFGAHAWVEHGGRVLGDRADHVGSFTELASGRVPAA